MMKRILPPTYFMIGSILAPLFHYLFPFIIIIKSAYRFFAIVPVVFGIVLNIWADDLLKKYNTTVKPNEKPTKLVSSGAFRISRHPMYLGMATVLFGESIFLGSLSSFIVPVLFAVLMKTKFIPKEEASMMKAFGNEYCMYKKEVKRWI
ncbi:isoprenylcysteine carboxylmethyltransferase family protein [Candidatus Woesearchaeota archaeon]|nr:isoprenylcysteine carboxylmethyltransferase family protein [Candidatus Woesearchaeota archaeon]